VVGDQRLELLTLLPVNPAYRVIKEGGDVGQYRLEYDVSGSAESYLLNVISLRDQSDAPITATLSQEQGDEVWKIRLSHPSRGTVEIQLRQGLTSQGGSVTIGGITRNLRSDVQSMIIGDNGPMWAE
jgi:hypothetical protein